MNRLVALAIPASARFVDELQRAWDAGDAVLPVDDRLPAPLVTQLLAELGAAEVVDSNGDRTAVRSGRPVEPGDALVMATSGTTGRPKGVVLTHAAIEASSQATSARLGIDPDRHRWLACLPVAHIGGLSVILRSLHTSTPFTVLPSFDPTAVTAAADAGATHVSLVSTALRRIDPSRFERIVLGGQDVRGVLDEQAEALKALIDEAQAPCWAPDAPSDGPCPVE